MPRLITIGFILFLSSSVPAFADSDDAFGSSIVLASSTLSSVVTGSTVDLQLANSPLSIGGNTISGKAFEGVTGVIALVQNTGLNANIQQAVSVAVGRITIGGLTQ